MIISLGFLNSFTFAFGNNHQAIFVIKIAVADCLMLYLKWQKAPSPCSRNVHAVRERARRYRARAFRSPSYSEVLRDACVVGPCGCFEAVGGPCIRGAAFPLRPIFRARR